MNLQKFEAKVIDLQKIHSRLCKRGAKIQLWGILFSDF